MSVRIATAVIVGAGLLAVPAALGKDFRPGDLRVCGRDRCVQVTNRAVLRKLSNFYYGSTTVRRADRVRPGAPEF